MDALLPPHGPTVRPTATPPREEPDHTPPTGPWDDWHNAEIYDDFVRSFPIYRELNRRLAERAQLATARRVLDLACGTGATARACVRRLPADAEVLGVDGSVAMVAVAAARTEDPRAHFRVSSAATIEQAVRGPFDRVLSSAALWQFPAPGAVIAAVGRLLTADGLFVFNVPAHRLADQPCRVHPLQLALADAIAQRLGRPHEPAPDLHLTTLRAWLHEAGFAAVDVIPHTIASSQDELLELMRIPAMAERMAPDLPTAERGAALDAAALRVDLEQRVEVAWIDIVAHKAASTQDRPTSTRTAPRIDA